MCRISRVWEHRKGKTLEQSKTLKETANFSDLVLLSQSGCSSSNHLMSSCVGVKWNLLSFGGENTGAAIQYRRRRRGCWTSWTVLLATSVCGHRETRLILRLVCLLFSHLLEMSQGWCTIESDPGSFYLHFVIEPEFYCVCVCFL